VPPDVSAVRLGWKRQPGRLGAPAPGRSARGPAPLARGEVSCLRA